jgi:hypothetical protein
VNNDTPMTEGGCYSMEQNGEREKRRAHELIEKLAPQQTSALVELLEVMLDPVSQALANAPIDDEPESEEERRAVAESKKWFEHHGGRGIPHEEVVSDFSASKAAKNVPRRKQRA